MRVVRSMEIEKPVIIQTLKDLAEYYFTSITSSQLEMYVEDLLPLGSELVNEAAKQYRRSVYNSKFPLPVFLKKEAIKMGEWKLKEQNEKKYVC
jgi:hypothetical protein